jgi:hypothetical protein
MQMSMFSFLVRIEKQVNLLNFIWVCALSVFFHLFEDIIPLKRSKSNINKFEKGKIDKFELKLPYLGDLQLLKYEDLNELKYSSTKFN